MRPQDCAVLLVLAMPGICIGHEKGERVTRTMLPQVLQRLNLCAIV